MAIASTSYGHNVPPPGPAEAPVRTTASELTDEQRGWDWQRGYLKDRPQQPWTHIRPGSTGGR
jgi:hypothetical protein